MFKNVASQKVVLYAYNSTTGAPVVGLTTGATFAPYVSINGAAPAALGTTTVTELDATNLPGWYAVQPSQAETNGDMLLFGGKSSTSNVYINGFPIFTDPPNYTTLSVDGSGRAKGDVDTIKTQSVTCAAGVTVLASVGTAATSTAQTGDNFARLGAPAGASVSADIAAIKSDTGTILTDVNSGAGAIYTRIGAPAGASIAADIAALPTANANADALLDRANAIETAWTLRKMLRIAFAALGGKASGMGTATGVFRAGDDSKDRITATIDASGNRTAVTLDGT